MCIYNYKDISIINAVKLIYKADIFHTLLLFIFQSSSSHETPPLYFSCVFSLFQTQRLNPGSQTVYFCGDRVAFFTQYYYSGAHKYRSLYQSIVPTNWSVVFHCMHITDNLLTYHWTLLFLVWRRYKLSCYEYSCLSLQVTT